MAKSPYKNLLIEENMKKHTTYRFNNYGNTGDLRYDISFRYYTRLSTIRNSYNNSFAAYRLYLPVDSTSNSQNKIILPW